MPSQDPSASHQYVATSTKLFRFDTSADPPEFVNVFSVLFQIELLSFVDHKAADEFYSFSREDREIATLDQIIAVATAEKDVSGID